MSLAGPAGALSYSQHYLQPISVTLLRGIVSSECMVGRRNRTASRASLVCMKSRNTPVVVAAPSGALKQLNLREQRIAVAFVGGSPKPPSDTSKWEPNWLMDCYRGHKREKKGKGGSPVKTGRVLADTAARCRFSCSRLL